MGFKSDFLLISTAAILFFGCGKKSLAPDDYKRWMVDENNGMVTQSTIGDFTFSLYYLPLDWKIVSSGQPAISEEDFQNKKSEMQGMEYFMLRVAASDDSDVFKKDTKDISEAYERMDYFDYGMQDDLSLLLESDTIPCVLYHAENSNHAYPFVNIMLGFNTNKHISENNSDRVFIYNDKLLGLGKVTLVIRGKDLDSMPNIKLS